MKQTSILSKEGSDLGKEKVMDSQIGNLQPVKESVKEASVKDVKREVTKQTVDNKINSNVSLEKQETRARDDNKSKGIQEPMVKTPETPKGQIKDMETKKTNGVVSTKRESETANGRNEKKESTGQPKNGSIKCPTELFNISTQTANEEGTKNRGK